MPIVIRHEPAVAGFAEAAYRQGQLTQAERDRNFALQRAELEGKLSGQEADNRLRYLSLYQQDVGQLRGLYADMYGQESAQAAQQSRDVYQAQIEDRQQGLAREQQRRLQQQQLAGSERRDVFQAGQEQSRQQAQFGQQAARDRFMAGQDAQRQYAGFGQQAYLQGQQLGAQAARDEYQTQADFARLGLGFQQQDRRDQFLAEQEAIRQASGFQQQNYRDQFLSIQDTNRQEAGFQQQRLMQTSSQEFQQQMEQQALSQRERLQVAQLRNQLAFVREEVAAGRLLPDEGRMVEQSIYGILGPYQRREEFQQRQAMEQSRRQNRQRFGDSIFHLTDQETGRQVPFYLNRDNGNVTRLDMGSSHDNAFQISPQVIAQMYRDVRERLTLPGQPPPEQRIIDDVVRQQIDVIRSVIPRPPQLVQQQQGGGAQQPPQQQPQLPQAVPGADRRPFIGSGGAAVSPRFPQSPYSAQPTQQAQPVQPAQQPHVPPEQRPGYVSGGSTWEQHPHPQYTQVVHNLYTGEIQRLQDSVRNANPNTMGMPQYIARIETAVDLEQVRQLLLRYGSIQAMPPADRAFAVRVSERSRQLLGSGGQQGGAPQGQPGQPAAQYGRDAVQTVQQSQLHPLQQVNRDLLYGR